MTSNQAQPGVIRDPYEQQRAAMVEMQIRHRGVTDERVLQVMAAVPRHEFVAPQWQSRAYLDEPVPIRRRADYFSALYCGGDDRDAAVEGHRESP